MKSTFALFAAAALCATAQENPAPAGIAAKTAEAVAALEEACPAPAAAEPDFTFRVKSLDALRETVTAFTTLIGQPQYGLMATMGLSSAIAEAGLSDIRTGDPAYCWFWNFADFLATDGEGTPVILCAVPVAVPDATLEEALERMDSDDPDAPAVWTDGDDLFVAVRGGWTLAASDPALFARADALLAAPPALPEATFSFASDTLQSWLPAVLDASDAMESPFEQLDAFFDDGQPAWLKPVVAFLRDAQELNRQETRDLASIRFGLRCDLSNGLVGAMSATPAPGTATAAQYAAVKTPLAPDALAGIPASAFFWGAVADATEFPQGVNRDKLLESARKNLLPLVEDAARRARADAFLVRALRPPNARAGVVFAAPDGEGRPYAKGVTKLVSVERERKDLRELGDFARAEIAACTNFPLASIVEVPEGDFSATIRVRAFSDAVVDAVYAKLAEKGDEAADDLKGKADIAKSRAQILEKVFGEAIRAEVKFDGDVATSTVGAAGATPPAGPALAADFGAESLFFPGQTRFLAIGIDVAGFSRTIVPFAIEAFAEAADALGDMDDDDKAQAAGAVAAVRAAFPSSAPLYFTYGMDKGAMTGTMILPPACIQSFVALGTLAETLASGHPASFDDDDPFFDDDDVDFDDDDDFGDEDFDDGLFDDGDALRAADDDENEYGNPDPADLDDDDVDE